MAGIGEASAVITVAQVGISLSFTLISFIGDVRDARKRIKIVADEILLTSQRLKELGSLIEKNDKTKFFGEESLKSTVTLAKGCEVALTEIRLVLKKGSVKVDPTEAKKDEIEIGSFSNWLWPWTKVQLGPPRADLATLKDDLQLLYLSVMANNASSAAERSKYTQSIPGFYRSRQSSAAERDRALRRRTQSRKQRPSRHSGEEDPGAMSEEEEVLLRLDSLQERELAEENERRMREQAAAMARLRALEEEKKAQEKAREEERKVREIERRAVEEWKVKNEEEEKARQKELAENRDRLKRSLLKEHLSNNQIQSILENLNIEDPLSVGPSSGKESSSSSNRDNAQPITRTVERTSSGRESKLSRIFSYLGKGSPRSSIYTSSISSSASTPISPGLGLGPENQTEVCFEAWALNQDPEQQTRVPLPGPWLEKYATKKICPSKSLLKRYSFLSSDYKTQINKLLEEQNEDLGGDGWFLVSLQAVNQILRENILRRHEVKICVLVVLGRLRPNDIYSDGDADISSMSSRATRPDRLHPSGSPKEEILQSLRIHPAEPPTLSLGPSSAPPPPPPGTSVSIMPPPRQPLDVVPPPPPPDGVPGRGASYRGSTLPTRPQSSYRSLAPTIIDSTRPSGGFEPLSKNPSNPVRRTYDTDADESRPHVSFAADERDSVPYTNRRPRPYDSGSQAGWPGPILPAGVERSGHGNLPVYPDMRREGSALPPDEWVTIRRPPYRPGLDSPPRPYQDSLYYARENEMSGSRPAAQSENNDWDSLSRHHTSRHPRSYWGERDEPEFGSILSPSVMDGKRETRPSDTQWGRNQGPTDGGKRTTPIVVSELPDNSEKTGKTMQVTKVSSDGYHFDEDPTIRVYDAMAVHHRAPDRSQAYPEQETGLVPMYTDPERPTWLKMSRRHVSLTTLMAFKLPWHLQEEDPNYVLIERWVPKAEQQALWDHTNKLRKERSRGAFRARSVSRHNRTDVQRSGTSRGSSTTRAKFWSLASSDDDYESAISDSEVKGKTLLRTNPKNEIDDETTKEADEEIVERYLTRYTSMPDATPNAANAPSHADVDPWITQTGTVADASNISGQVFDEPGTLATELPTRDDGRANLSNAEISPVGRPESISSVVEQVPQRRSVSSSTTESAPRGERIPQLPPNTFVLES